LRLARLEGADGGRERAADAEQAVDFFVVLAGGSGRVGGVGRRRHNGLGNAGHREVIGQNRLFKEV